jgi:hypothetical protein
VHNLANKIVLQLADNTPTDYVYVLFECIDKENDGTNEPRGMIRSLAAALGVYDAVQRDRPAQLGPPDLKEVG